MTRETTQTDDARPHERTEHLCVTCGEYKPTEKFEEGDCTCNDCYAEGRGDVNYDINDAGEVVEL